MIHAVNRRVLDSNPPHRPRSLSIRAASVAKEDVYSITGKPDWKLSAAHAVDEGSKLLSLSLSVSVPSSESNALKGLIAHWACNKDWKPPPNGWKTTPAKSKDGGGGAWQTEFELQTSNDSTNASLQLLLPLAGPLERYQERNKGISFVLKTTRGEWLQDASSNQDFFISTSQGSSPHDFETKPWEEKKDKDGSREDLSQKPREKKKDKKREGKGHRSLTQSERDAMLPDVTKGVPWLPNQQQPLDDDNQEEEDGMDSLHERDDDDDGWSLSASSLLGAIDVEATRSFVQSFKPSHRDWSGLSHPNHAQPDASISSLKAPSPISPPSIGNSDLQPCSWMVGAISAQERNAERSLMHRYDSRFKA